MALYLNLLAEQQAEEEARRRDPVKRAYWVGVAVVALVGIYSLSLALKCWVAREQLKAQQTRWQAMATNFQQVLTLSNQVVAARQRFDALQDLASNRFSWVPALNALQLTTTDLVRLTRLTGNQTLVSEVVNRKLGEKQVNVTNLIEHKLLTLEGVVGGGDTVVTRGDAVVTVERFRSNLSQMPYFRSALLATNGVLLKEFSARPESSESSKLNWGFIVECLFPDRTH